MWVTDSQMVMVCKCYYYNFLSKTINRIQNLYFSTAYILTIINDFNTEVHEQ